MGTYLGAPPSPAQRFECCPVAFPKVSPPLLVGGGVSDKFGIHPNETSLSCSRERVESRCDEDRYDSRDDEYYASRCMLEFDCDREGGDGERESVTTETLNDREIAEDIWTRDVGEIYLRPKRKMSLQLNHRPLKRIKTLKEPLSPGHGSNYRASYDHVSVKSLNGINTKNSSLGCSLESISEVIHNTPGGMHSYTDMDCCNTEMKTKASILPSLMLLQENSKMTDCDSDENMAKRDHNLPIKCFLPNTMFTDEPRQSSHASTCHRFGLSEI